MKTLKFYFKLFIATAIISTILIFAFIGFINWYYAVIYGGF